MNWAGDRKLTQPVFMATTRIRDLFRVFSAAAVILAIQLIATTSFAQTKEIIAAVPKSFPPYYQIDEQGQTTGFAIEIMDAIALQAGVRVRYLIKDSWKGVFNAAKSGEIDLIPNVGVTEARKSYLNFTTPVETFPISIFVRKDTSDIKGSGDLIGRSVGAVKTNVGSKIAAKIKGLNLKKFLSFEQAIFALLSGQVDALIYPGPVAWKLATAAGYQGDLKVVGVPLKEIKRALGIRKGDKELFNRLSAAVENFVATEEYRNIYRRWFAEAPPFWTNVKLFWTFGGIFTFLLIAFALWRHYMLVGLKVELDKQVEERTQELIEAEFLKQQILSSAGEGIYGLDDQGVTTFVNPAACKLLGFTEDQLIGQPIHKLIHHSHPDGSPYPHEQCPMYATFTDGEAHSEFNEVLWRKDGTPFPVHYTSTPLRKDGELVGAVITFNDVTEIKERELELKRSNTELQHFAYAAAHDLQEPLRKIQAFSERLETKYMDELDEGGRGYIERIVSSATRMRLLIDDLLNYSRITTKAKPFQPTDLNDLLHEVLEDLETLISQSETEVETAPLPTIDADHTQMRQLLQNVISNAIKFRKEDAPLNINISSSVSSNAKQGTQNPNLCHIVIRDTGIGFDPKFKDKIFGIFERLHGRSEFSGTGIGLATCKKIAERHGGQITAESSPGDGSTFRISLPLTQSEDKTL